MIWVKNFGYVCVFVFVFLFDLKVKLNDKSWWMIGWMGWFITTKLKSSGHIDFGDRSNTEGKVVVIERNAHDKMRVVLKYLNPV